MNWMKLGIAAAVTASCGWVEAADAFAAPVTKDVRLQGVAGASADACIRARAYSDWARGR